MARIVTFSALLVGITAFLVFAGIATSGSFLTAIGFSNLANSTTSTMFLAVAAIFTLSLAGVIIGFISNRSAESYIVAAFSSTLLTIGVIDIVSIWGYMNTFCGLASDCLWAGNIVKLFASILLATYLISMVQWWRGNDS